MWNVALCLNRCTALAFSVKYDKIWNPFTMFLVVIIMLAFPFVIDAYTLFQANCSVSTFSFCLAFRKAYFLKGTIVNAILNGIMIILIGISMYRSRQDKFQATSMHAKTERRLIYQAIFSSIIQLICFAL
uniref:Serpentine receptor class gamma n=1 Tax=Panagrolaimus sp. ES5 TaxID=591445 RepID=A0AC34F671_9BILA